MTGVVLGIDGGGSKTLLALATEDGDIAAWRSGPGTNPFDQPDWQSLLSSLMAQTCAETPPIAAAAGLGGYGELPEVVAAQHELAKTTLICPHTLHNDVQVAFDGAFLGRAGVLILAGTGSMAWAQTIDEKPVRVGGWGHAIGDEGSAFWIGTQALVLTSQTLDGRCQAHDLTTAMLAEMGPAADGKAVTLLRWHQTRTHLRSEVAALARIVDALAERGESVAMGLMRRAADQLCLHVDAARRRIGEADSAWSHAGSVFASATIRQAMTARLGPPTPPALPPIGGALWRAARLAGWNPDSAWIARLAAALATHSDPEKQART